MAWAILGTTGLLGLVSRQGLKKILLGLVAATLGMTSPVFAGPLEDGQDAYQRGNYDTAIQHWLPLANEGNAAAQIAIGGMYFSGRGVGRNPAEAAKWFLLAAEQGDAKGQFALAGLFYSGIGARRDYEEAARWTQLAAEQGRADAQYALGTMYMGGEGVGKTFTEALKWFQLAAEQGSADAQLLSGILYELGAGVPKDNVLAYKWLALASSHLPAAEQEKRERAVNNREYVAAKLTPEQRTEAERLVREWQPK